MTRRPLLPGHLLFSRPKKMRPAGIRKSARDIALPDICVPLCISKTSYYVPACEKDGKTSLRGEGARSSACEKDAKTSSRGERVGSSGCEKDGKTLSRGSFFFRNSN